MKVTDIEKKELTNYIELFDYDSYLKDKRILITGSKGLVGTGLVKWILFQNQLKGTITIPNEPPMPSPEKTVHSVVFHHRYYSSRHHRR